MSVTILALGNPRLVKETFVQGLDAGYAVHKAVVAHYGQELVFIGASYTTDLPIWPVLCRRDQKGGLRRYFSILNSGDRELIKISIHAFYYDSLITVSMLHLQPLSAWN